MRAFSLPEPLRRGQSGLRPRHVEATSGVERGRVRKENPSAPARVARRLQLALHVNRGGAYYSDLMSTTIDAELRHE